MSLYLINHNNVKQPITNWLKKLYWNRDFIVLIAYSEKSKSRYYNRCILIRRTYEAYDNFKIGLESISFEPFSSEYWQCWIWIIYSTRLVARLSWNNEKSDETTWQLIIYNRVRIDANFFTTKRKIFPFPICFERIVEEKINHRNIKPFFFLYGYTFITIYNKNIETSNWCLCF